MKLSFSPHTPLLFGVPSGVNSPESSLCDGYDGGLGGTVRTRAYPSLMEELVARMPALAMVVQTGRFEHGLVSDIVLDEHTCPRVHLFGESVYRYVASETKVTREIIDACMTHCTPTTCHNRFSSDDQHRVSVFPTSTGTNLTIRLTRQSIDHEMPKKLCDDIDGGKNVLIFGAPGTGKTTCLRTVLRHLDAKARNAVAIDQSDELRCPGIGSRVFSPSGSLSDAIHEVIRNHTPSCIVLDEIVTKQDALAVLHANDRGVQVIATTHASSVDDIAASPLLTSLNGGRREAAVSDGSAKKNGGHKFVVERRTAPVFASIYDVRKKTVHSTVHVIDKALASR